MCEKLLLDTLDNVIQLNPLLEWIKNPNSKHINFKYTCNQVEFITYFLNYVHEITTRSSKIVQKADENNSGNDLTPKRRNALVENLNNLNDSLDTHMSPLYKQHPFAKRLPSPKTPPNICLGDFLIHKESKKKIQKNLNESAFNSCARRINPTNISQTKINTTFTQNRNSFTFNKNEGSVDFSNRNNLIEERSKVIFKKDVDSSQTIAVAKVMNTKLGEEPIFKLVTFQDKLDILIDIYVFLLNNSFVVNVTSEIYFIVTVLLNKEYVSDITLQSPLNIFNSVHNQVYFAARVLQQQTDFLRLLDKFTIRTLFANTRLLQFTKPDFYVNFFQTYESEVRRQLDTVQELNQSVYFECETDNRNNFSTNLSFNNFRKQRDLFYEILQTWEKCRLLHDWNFTKMLGQKIRYLINLDLEPNNFVHFAKLFKAQLLVNICQDVAMGDEQTIRSAIPNVDEDKLSKLNTRIGKKSCNGINELPIFTNYEEFYKDFLLIAANPLFNKHFIDAVAAEIVTINNSSFEISDKDEFDTFSDSIRASYINKVKKLRILAKFLGFFESLPYRSNCAQLPESVITSQLEIRNKIQLTLNLKEILLDALNKKYVTLTISWLVKYLAMLDCVTMKINQIQEIIQILFEIYRNSSNYPIIVKLCLGWLFELPHFPNGLYYTWLSNMNYNEAFALPNVLNRNFQLDDLNIYDNEVLHICCPYLYEIKKIITADANSSNRTVTFKHITPITAVDIVSQTPNKRLQNRLEEMFFSIQPDSVKRTVDFVSERVASGCIKEICYEIVPSYKKEAVLKLRFEIEVESVDVVDHLRKYAESCITNLLNIIKSKIDTILEVRITAALEALLSSTVLKQTKELCIYLTNRMCHERVQQWVKSHVTQDIFTNNFDNEIKKLKQAKVKTQFMISTFDKCNQHNTSSYSGFKIMEILRELCWNVIEGHSVTLMDIELTLDSVHVSLHNRCDLNESISLNIHKLLLDFFLLVIAYTPECITVDLAMKFCTLYKGCGIDDLVKRLLSPRNIFILSTSSLPRSTANSFGILIDALLENGLLTSSSIDMYISNCLDENLSSCFNEILNKYKIKTDH